MATNKPVVRKGHDSRVVYANATVIQFMGIDAIIRFSIMDDVSDPSSSGMEEQVAVAMNVVNFKALGQIIMALVTHHEQLTKTTIEVSPLVKQRIEEAIAPTKKFKELF